MGDSDPMTSTPVTPPLMSNNSINTENSLDMEPLDTELDDLELNNLELDDIEVDDPRQRLPFAALLGFVALYFLRPWDHLPALAAARPMMLMTVVTVGLYLLSRPRIEFLAVRPVKLLLALLAVMCFSVVFSYWPSKSLTVATEYMKHIALFVLIVNMVTTIDRLKKLSAVMVACCALHGGFALANYASAGHDQFKGVAKGNFEDPNDLALTLVLMLPIAWWLSSVVQSSAARLAAYGSAMLLVGGVVATQSRGGLMALVAAASVMVLSQGRGRRSATLLALAAAVVIAVVVLPAEVFDRYTTIAEYQKDESAMTRLAIWKAGARMFADHPLTGVGAGTFEIVYGESYIDRKVAGNTWRVAHNSYIQVAAELGVFGLAIWVAIVAWALLSLLRSRRLLMDDTLSSTDFRDLDLKDNDLKDNDELRIGHLRKWNAALLASIVGFLVGAVFLSRGYDMLFMILLALVAVSSRRVEAIAADRA